MELYIGGYAQGKLAYVMSRYAGADVYDETNYKELIEILKRTDDTGSIIVVNHFNQILKEIFLSYKQNSDENNTSDVNNTIKMAHEFTEMLIQSETRCKCKLVIISDEIGCGIVPMDKIDRMHRECTGRMLTKIAQKAETVERIICMIPQKIK